MSKKRRCPKCGSKKVIHIVYCYPSLEAEKKAEQGKIKLGGCVVSGDAPEWFCCECEEKF